ncbi:DUF4345 domain-containing protein [Kitasatospora cathayae]|uniref:DUF4345 domain-containing protein n=1 Tax=Kitasatospora cathayae TaxID=3004092 RepID=A0ABY7QCN5_9ACTN|nr:DUF4345 domain-containing protein [Kitasatospora sp. HUAS 3-15]WBP89979.1 DUF4345 domain-containing protein [Kitasatospora sp. HUAS 3-15]
MAKALRVLAWTMGVACVAIGFLHLLGGSAAFPGIADPGPTVDSFGRFMGAIFAGYGAAWIWAARQAPVPARAVRWLTAVFLLGGLGRVLGIAVDGRPHWFQLVLMGIELGLPPVYFWLADADERAVARTSERTDERAARA